MTGIGRTVKCKTREVTAINTFVATQHEQTRINHLELELGVSANAGDVGNLYEKERT